MGLLETHRRLNPPIRLYYSPLHVRMYTFRIANFVVCCMQCYCLCQTICFTQTNAIYVFTYNRQTWRDQFKSQRQFVQLVSSFPLIIIGKWCRKTNFFAVIYHGTNLLWHVTEVLFFFFLYWFIIIMLLDAKFEINMVSCLNSTPQAIIYDGYIQIQGWMNQWRTLPCFSGLYLR